MVKTTRSDGYARGRAGDRSVYLHRRARAKAAEQNGVDFS